ncbi:MAG TPA: metallopeptidase TldD-related protein [Bryobacteraceae bacterium]|nr:metallopeptidase TldD-related protein [Bryobacteraceae bacterium]
MPRVAQLLLRRVRKSVSIVVLAAGAVSAAETPKLVDILSSELDRNFRTLQEKGDPKPYFAAYAVTDNQLISLESTSGLLAGKDSRHIRSLDVTVRVGTPKLDNYHRQPRDIAHFTLGSVVSLDDNPNALKRRLWLDTDAVYRSAAQRLTNIKTDTQVKVDAQDQSDDFSTAEPSVAFRAVPEIKVNEKQWADRLRNWSRKLSSAPEILNSTVSFQAQREVKTFVNTDGTRLQHGRTFARIIISARSKAFDGMDLATSDTIEADEPGRLPDPKVVDARIDKVMADLRGLLRAPEVDPFVGPAILSGRASGVFFHEIFGHRIEGHRQKDESEGQTFTKRVNKEVLPDFLSVFFDPTLHHYANEDLYGWYDYDDEGVKARRVSVVESGILKTFLLSRSPIAGFPTSNGHGRRQAGAEIVARQSNLVVESSRKVPQPELRKMLIEEIKRQGKPYGLYFESVTGGYTTTRSVGLQAFTVIPLVVYRIYPDGRPDELVRGADIVGTPLASFAKILATSDKLEVFNGYCGAESGSVPVSASSPAILVSEIEVQRKNRSQDRPPLLPRPMPQSGGAE